MKISKQTAEKKKRSHKTTRSEDGRGVKYAKSIAISWLFGGGSWLLAEAVTHGLLIAGSYLRGEPLPGYVKAFFHVMGNVIVVLYVAVLSIGDTIRLLRVIWDEVVSSFKAPVNR